jgi:hypothetical protein
MANFFQASLLERLVFSLAYTLQAERGSAMFSPLHMLWRRMLSQDVDRLPLVSFVSCACLVLALLLTGCASASAVTSRATSTPAAGPIPASTGIPQAAPSSQAGGPAPVTTPLAAPPQNCVLTSPPQQQHLDHLGLNSNVQLVGGGPFWIYGFFYQSVIHLGQTNEQWPMTKIVVEVGPNYALPVTLQLQNQQTGALAWWTDAQTPPGAATQTLVLDPQTDTEDVGHVAGVPDIPHGSPDPGWKEWGLFPMFSTAGCYALKVSWSGGSWQSIFAVGS